ncbi:uncharacterized protein PV07_11871 [Cladophialophora immunda]|uniref:Fungal N-terminal domain-containing protein n=1 Tax=Cladophialophora immunda TaxID=569365 RepID=A0A0D1Z7S3_9EURO|nr:uncharacterized protein PV07_11871 [Cladophialophora immunda]KIW23691.1 hypothetical protein PV07_11871 [Cladophialophora immunda]
MEVIGAVASIGGVIQLVLHGVKFVEFLKIFAENCGTEAAADFVHGLVAYAQLLHDVQALCDCIQQHRNPCVSQIRIATLRLCLEDCVQDLETWHAIVKRLERTDRRASKALAKFTEARSPQKRFQLFLREALGSAMAAKNAHVRTVIQARFEKHKASVGVALSILEANLQLVQVDDNDRTKAGIDKLAGLVEAQARNHDQNYSDVRSSNSSIIAWSKSQHERLQELRSMQSSLSEKMDNLLQALSTHSSQHSSRSSDSVAGPAGALQHIDNKKLGENPSPPGSKEMTDCLSRARSNLVLETDKLDSRSETDESGEDTNPRSIIELLEDFNLLAGQYFDGIIAEYIFAAEQWRFASMRQRFIGIIERREDANRMLMNVNLKVNLLALATTLLSLRRRAEAECLQLSLEEADGLLGITLQQIRHWELVVEQNRANSAVERLILPDNARSTKSESLTRLNEWLFEVMTSIPYLADWHRWMTSSQIPQQKEPEKEPTILKKEPPLLKKDDWERLTIKTWLLDGTNWDIPDDYAASSFTNSRESDLTVLVSGSSNDHDIGEADLDRFGDDIGLFKQPVANIYLLRGLKKIEDVNELTLPSPGAGSEVIERAEKALRKYAEEPSSRWPRDELYDQNMPTQGSG